MIVTKSRLNRHETDIINAIEKEGLDGIHVQGLIKKYKFSPTTVNQYLPILENEKKLIYHTRMKNKDVYYINMDQRPSYEELVDDLTDISSDLEHTILSAIEHAKKWSIAEQVEVFQHAVNVITLVKYIGDYLMDISDKELPEELEDMYADIDEIQKKVNKSVNLFFHSIVLVQIGSTIDESLDYLRSVKKRKHGKQSKYVKEIVEQMANEVQKLEPEFKKLNITK